MSQSRLSRPFIILLAALGVVSAAAVFALAALAVSRAASELRAGPIGPAVRWTGLPVPATVQPEWTSFTYAGPIRDLATADGLLWAATDGGLVVWDLRAGGGSPPVTKFLVEHGLAANQVRAVAIGADRSIWAATAGGVSRYDGRQWQTWRTADGLPTNDARDLEVGRDGIIWVATNDGLVAYDGRRWRRYGSEGAFAPLPRDDVRDLAIGPDNRLWAAAGDGLVAYDGQWEAVATVGGPGGEPITHLAVEPGGAVWAATEAGLSRYAGGVWSTFGPVGGLAEQETWAPSALAATADGVLLARPAGAAALLQVDSVGGVTTVVGPDERHAAGAMLFDDAGGLWLGSGDVVYRRTMDGWASLATPSELPSATIESLRLSDGRVLVATEDGLAEYDGRWTIQTVSDGLPADGVQALDDDEGTLWAAFADPRDGLARYAGGRWQPVDCAADGPPDRDINALALDGQGGLWLASDGGVGHFDGQTWRRFTPRQGLPDMVARDIVVDDLQNVWAGGPGGLARYDGGAWRPLDPSPIDALALGPDGPLWALSRGRVGRLQGVTLDWLPPLPNQMSVRDLAADSAGPWLATSDGVAHFTREGWRLLTTEAGLPSNDVTAVAVDEAGGVWAAASGDTGQIDIVTYVDGRWQPHPSRDPAAERLLSNVVTDILTTPDGNVWLATAEGVNRFYDGGQRAYTDADGLPGRTVRQLAYAFDSVWAATEIGLARFNGSMWLPGAAFSAGAHGQGDGGIAALAVAPDGELWVGLDAPQENALRVFDGRAWRVVPLISPATEVRRLAFLPETPGEPARLVALVSEAGQERIGLFDGGAWTWQAAADLPIRIDQLAVPDGRLWTSGMVAGENGAQPGIAVFRPDAAGLGEPVALFTQANDPGPGPDFALGGVAAPFVLQEGPQPRVLFGGPGTLYAFPAGAVGTMEPVTIVDLPLAFSRHIFGLDVDQDGRLWVGTERGVAVLGPEDGESRTFYAPAISPAWWGSARSLTPRPDGSLLLGTASGGIGLYTGRGFDGIMRPSQGPQEWASSRPPISSILLDPSGTLWAGSEGGGLAAFDGVNWQVFAPDPVLTSATRGLAVAGDEAWLATEAGLVRLVGLSSGRCILSSVDDRWPARALMEDAVGDIWVGTAEDGLLRLAAPDRAPEPNWPGSDIPALGAGPGGELWVANARQNWLTWRAASAEAENGRWDRLPLDLNVVRPESINALAVSPTRVVWLGTDEGAAVYNGSWQRLTTSNGLADNLVTDLLMGTDGSVWLATAGGLSRFTPRAGLSTGAVP